MVTPKRENKWKIISEEGMSTPLTSHYPRPDTFGLVAGGYVLKPALRISETFRDVTNYHQSSMTVTPPLKMKKEMLPSRE